MTAHYQMVRYQQAISAAPLTNAERLERIRNEIALAADDEDRADWRRVETKFLTLNPDLV